jgi:protein-tyrosine-phosphatase
MPLRFSDIGEHCPAMSLEDIQGSDEVVKAHLDDAVRQLSDEFDGIHRPEVVHAMVHESAAQLSGGHVAAFVPALAHRFARERLRARAQTEGLVIKGASEVLFVSLTGGGRAQMAAALLTRRAGNLVSVHSAGSDATGGADANVVAAMEEIGIDMGDHFTKPLTDEVLAGADVVVTMGRSVGRVEIPARTRHVAWRVGDPSGAELDEVRRVREDIERRVEALAAELLQPMLAAADRSDG